MHKTFRIGFGVSCADNRKSKTCAELRRSIQNRKFTFLVGALLLVLSFPANAQQTVKIARIGYLDATSPAASSARIEAFRQGLRELGYVEGKNTVIEYRSAEGNPQKLPDLASELVSLNVDVILAEGSAPRAAKQVTTTIPIIMSNNGDPIGTGLIASLARPGGNVTGLSTTPGPEIYGKNMELLKETIPKLTRVVVLTNPTNPISALVLKGTETAARAFKVSLHPLEARVANEYDTVFAAAIKERAGAILVVQDPMFFGDRKRLADLAIKNRLPAMYGILEHVEAGGLMAYAANRIDLFRRAATYVDKILKGAKPAELPVEQPTKFELVINLKTAKQIGLTIPPNVLARADKVIR
jgi:putative ABC transport system substrate-binding protein